MKFQIDPLSMLSGAALLGLCFLASSGVQASSLTAAQVSTTLRLQEPVEVMGILSERSSGSPGAVAELRPVGRAWDLPSR